MKKAVGFSLLEIIVVLVIVAILVVIAVPVYQGHVVRSNRADAIHTVLAIQLAQKKYRTNNAQYGTLAKVWNGVTLTEGGHYKLAITNVTPTTYTITATAVGGGSQVGDTQNDASCVTLTLAYANGITTKTPKGCWFGS